MGKKLPGQLFLLILVLSIVWFIAGEIQGKGRLDKMLKGAFGVK